MKTTCWQIVLTGAGTQTYDTGIDTATGISTAENHEKTRSRYRPLMAGKYRIEAPDGKLFILHIQPVTAVSSKTTSKHLKKRPLHQKTARKIVP